MAPRLEITSTGATEIVQRLRERTVRLANIEPLLVEAAEIVYTEVAHWYESRGEGSWPALAPSTIASKISQGRSDPERPLYAEGNLFASATSKSGPHSFFIPNGDWVVLGVDWDRGGWQIPVLLSEGTTRMPARPIWPPRESISGQEILRAVGELFLKGL